MDRDALINGDTIEPRDQDIGNQVSIRRHGDYRPLYACHTDTLAESRSQLE
jgi:hypothetical protein